MQHGIYHHDVVDTSHTLVYFLLSTLLQVGVHVSAADGVSPPSSLSTKYSLQNQLVSAILRSKEETHSYNFIIRSSGERNAIEVRH